MRDQLWMTDTSGAAARRRPHGPATLQPGSGVGIVASAYCRLINDDVRLARGGNGFDARPTSQLVVKPTIQTAQKHAEERRASGPYPWRPPE